MSAVGKIGLKCDGTSTPQLHCKNNNGTGLHSKVVHRFFPAAISVDIESDSCVLSDSMCEIDVPSSDGSLLNMR